MSYKKEKKKHERLLRRIKYKTTDGEDECINCENFMVIPFETMVYTEEPGCEKFDMFVGDKVRCKHYKQTTGKLNKWEDGSATVAKRKELEHEPEESETTSSKSS